MGKILVIGDPILDKTIFVKPSKFCGEAPVSAYSVERTLESPGGAAAVAYMCRVLGADVESIVTSMRLTTVKTRIVAEASGGVKQTLLRLDENRFVTEEDLQVVIHEVLTKEVDLILVSDYGKGWVTKEVMQAVRETKIPFIVDPYTIATHFYGALVVLPHRDLQSELWSTLADTVIQKLDKDGIEVTYCKQDLIDTHKSQARFVLDVCGAGDQMAATLAVCLVNGCTIEESVKVANIAAGLQVERYGITPVTQQEIENRHDYNRRNLS